MNWAGSNPKAVKMRLYQFGTVSNVYARREGEKDSLNNPKPIFENIGKTIAFLHFQGATDQELDLTIGEFNEVTPTAIFPIDSIIEDDAHIYYDYEEWEITATTRRDNHIVADAKQVKVLSNENSKAELKEGSLPIYE